MAEDPDRATLRSGDGRGPMWWAYETCDEELVSWLEERCVVGGLGPPLPTPRPLRPSCCCNVAKTPAKTLQLVGPQGSHNSAS